MPIRNLRQPARLAASLGAVACALGAFGGISALASSPASESHLFAGTGSSGDGPSPGVASSVAISKPTSVRGLSDGRAVFVDGGNSKVRIVATDGSISTLAHFPQLDIQAINYHPDGFVMTGSMRGTDRGFLRTYNSARKEWKSVYQAPASGNWRLESPQDVQITSDARYAYVAGMAGNRIGAVEIATGELWELNTTAKFKKPEGIGALADGSFLIADTGNNVIKRQDPNRNVTIVAGGGSNPAAQGGSPLAVKLDKPVDVQSIGTDGSFAISDYGNHRVLRVSGGPNPKVTTITGVHGQPGRSPSATPAATAKLNHAEGLSFDGLGNLFIADRDNHRIQRITNIPYVAAASPDPDPDQTPPVTQEPTSDPQQPGPNQPAPGGVPVGSGRPQREGQRSSYAADPPGGNQGGALIANQRPLFPARSSQLAPPAAPVVGERMRVSPQDGRVTVRLPGRRRAVILRGAASIPVGAVIDTTRGAIRLTAASGDRARTQTAVFSQGVFQLRQRKTRRPVTELVLRGKVSCATGSAGKATTSKRRKVRKLWGRGHGRFRTRGRRSAASVTGTIWGVTDRCDGTLTNVRRGSVSVRDFARSKTVDVTRGQKYLARNPR